MSREQLSLGELLLSLDSSELKEAEQVRAAVNQQLSTDRGGAVLSSLVDHYLDSSSPQAVLLLSAIREPHHKPLLEKLNECLIKPGSRLAAVTLLGHVIRNQPPWVHHISRSPLLQSLLRCLKTDTDVVLLITGVLVLITLLPMVPQAGKQHIFDFFDVFGRLASWSYKNPGHVPVVYLVHLHASVYSLFHRLYGMFPCNFISYLRLHYSMKENLDTFQEVVKPMLEHVRVHPELVTGTQDYELDPSRWKCYEVHDIVIECSRVSLDPLESSCEEEVYRDAPPSPRPPSLSLSSLSSPLTPNPSLSLSSLSTPNPSLSLSSLSTPNPSLSSLSTPHTHLNLNLTADIGSSSGSPSPSGRLNLNISDIQDDDATWSPSSHCGLSTPPPEPAALGSAPPLARTASISGVRSPSSATVPVTPLIEENQDGANNNQVKLVTEWASSFQPITSHEGRGRSDVINKDTDSEVRSAPPLSPSFTEGLISPSYELLFELALPRAGTLYIGKKTQEVLERSVGAESAEGEELNPVSPLDVLDQLIVHGHDAHTHLRRLNKSMEKSHFGGKQPHSMKTRGEELQSQLLLVHSQLMYERFKRQQHAIRNRRLLRRVINATTLEEQTVAMKGQLCVQDEEIRSLKQSLSAEQSRYTTLQQDTHTHTQQLHAHNAQLLLEQQEQQRERQRMKSELEESQSTLRAMEAELQRANHKAYNAEHQLKQLSLKLCSSEQLQQQTFLLNQQLVLMRETNRGLTEQIEALGTHQSTEEWMLQCTVGKEHQRLKESDIINRQKLESANHRTAELEQQLTDRDTLILDLKRLLDETKAQGRAELSACQSSGVALRRITQNLQTEMLHLYSQVDQQAGDISSVSGALPVRPRPSSSSVGIINGSVEPLSLSLSLSISPIESPLAVGSFLEQHARQLFGSPNQSEDTEKGEELTQEEEGLNEANEEVELEMVEQVDQLEQLVELVEPALLAEEIQDIPPPAANRGLAPPTDLTLAVRQRRHELSIMDYDETLPEF